MKILMFLTAGLLCAAPLFAAPPIRFLAENAAKSQLNLRLFWSGSLENTTLDGGMLHNRGEIWLHFLHPDITLRGGILDRRPLNFKPTPLLTSETAFVETLDTLFGDPQKRVTNFTGGLYHNPTGSRLLYGVLDEWGLPARIRNPWIRSPSYTEKHRPISANIKTAASSTKKDEVYLSLASPSLTLTEKTKIKAFVSAQTNVDDFTPAFSASLNFAFPQKTNLLLETFYTQKTLAPSKSSTWFSEKPPLPERETRLSAVGMLYKSPNFSVNGDFACSETFAVGTDIYASLGFTLTPRLEMEGRGRSARQQRPLAVSLAADGAGAHFVYRDGANHDPAFRTAGKIEWKGRRSSLLRVDTVLRAPGFGEAFNRSSSGIAYHFPARTMDSPPVRVTRLSLSTDRNAVNNEKINDGLSGAVGISVLTPKNPLGINLSATIKGISGQDSPSPYPGLSNLLASSNETSRTFDTASATCEFNWSWQNLQFRSKIGYSSFAEKDEKWDFALSTAARFRKGRLSVKVASSDFFGKALSDSMKLTISWRQEKTNIRKNN